MRRLGSATEGQKTGTQVANHVQTVSGNQRPVVHCRLVVLQHTLRICIVFLRNNAQYATVMFLYEMILLQRVFGGTQLTVDPLNELP